MGNISLISPGKRLNTPIETNTTTSSIIVIIKFKSTAFKEATHKSRQS